MTTSPITSNNQNNQNISSFPFNLSSPLTFQSSSSSSSLTSSSPSFTLNIPVQSNSPFSFQSNFGNFGKKEENNNENNNKDDNDNNNDNNNDNEGGSKFSSTTVEIPDPKMSNEVNVVTGEESESNLTTVLFFNF